MGLGKTLITLSALQSLKNQGKLGRVLVTSTKRIARHVWKDEVDRWGFDFTVDIADGTPTRKRKVIAGDAEIVCISVDSIKYAVGRDDFDTLVIDEATLVKNHKSARTKNVRKIAGSCSRVIQMTGSPTAGAGLQDIWSQAELLYGDDEENPLGSWWRFGNRWFKFDHFNRPHARAGAEDAVGSLLAPRVFRRELSEIAMPGIHTTEVAVDMGREQELALADAEIEENGTYSLQRTIASGFKYEAHWSGSVDTKWIGDGKIEALQEIRYGTDSNLLVFTQFQAEADRLREVFDAEVLDGRTSETQAASLIERWNAGRVPMLIGNAQAMGHGLNLQAGGHRIVWFSLPVSQEIYEQANARLYRSGQKAGTVLIHRLIARGSIDEQIAHLLNKKMLSQAALIQAVSEASG